MVDYVKSARSLLVTTIVKNKVKGSDVHTGMTRKTGYMLRCVAMAHPNPASGTFPVNHQINTPTFIHSIPH